MKAKDIVDKYISFFEKRGHKRIANSPLVPQNDPTTLFTSSGMQPLIQYFLGEIHPQGKRLVNVQNCFRAADIDEIGDNRHTTFFRMLGNWSLGDPARNASQRDAGGYFKKEQLKWYWEFLTKEIGLLKEKLYVTIFNGFNDISKDNESLKIWTEIFEKEGLNANERIFHYGADKNWWSRAGEPEKMPEGEPGGPDSEVFYLFDVAHDKKYGKECHPNCQCGRFMEIGNSVFMEYQKTKDNKFKPLPQKNVDFGGGVERLLAAVEDQNDVFQTSLFLPIVKSIERVSEKDYRSNHKTMQIIADHLVAAVFITAAGIAPSNKEQGYILRRLIRRGLDNFYKLEGKDIKTILTSIVDQYKETDPPLLVDFEKIKLTIIEEEQIYKSTLSRAKSYIEKKYPSTGSEQVGDEIKGVRKILSDDAFILYSTHGLSPTQIKSLGFLFDEQKFAEKMKEHQKVSRKGAEKKFRGGLADHSEKTIMGHTATHLLHQALRDILGKHVFQTGSNITNERVRFDFNFERKLTDEEIKKVENIINEKIKENLPVHFEIMTLDRAQKLGAIGLFDEKYEDKVKIYFIGNYSKEFCGGPHVEFTGILKRFKILKQENIGHGQRRIYSQVFD
ncbi:MAG: alanine--tRNA ligase [Candidatus Levybacteria bacterium]|nr:alanine--tRNA ligase [Candidatus Levybacteria bacterium]